MWNELPSPCVEHHYQLPPFRKKGPEKTHKKGRKSVVELKGSEEKRVHGESLRRSLHLGNNTVVCPWHPRVRDNENFFLLWFSPILCFPKRLWERSYFLNSTSKTNDSPHNICPHWYTSNNLENLYSQMSQELHVQIIFKEENVNFTHTEKHTELCMSVWRSWNRSIIAVLQTIITGWVLAHVVEDTLQAAL